MDINKESIRKEFEKDWTAKLYGFGYDEFDKLPAKRAYELGYIASAAPRDELLREAYEFMTNGSAGSYEAGLRWDKFLSRLRERGYSD